MAIQGPGGIRPPDGKGSQPKIDIPVSEHIQLEATKESLSHVISALKNQPQKEVGSFYRDRLNVLKRELDALEHIDELFRTKPQGYQEMLKPYLKEGEEIEHLQKALPLELHIVHEKIRAVQAARVLTEDLE